MRACVRACVRVCVWCVALLRITKCRIYFYNSTDKVYVPVCELRAYVRHTCVFTCHTAQNIGIVYFYNSTDKV